MACAAFVWGEAKTRARPEGDPDGVLASLEHALKRIDESDDEPLRRPQRNAGMSFGGWMATCVLVNTCTSSDLGGCPTVGDSPINPGSFDN